MHLDTQLITGLPRRQGSAHPPYTYHVHVHIRTHTCIAIYVVDIQIQIAIISLLIIHGAAYGKLHSCLAYEVAVNLSLARPRVAIWASEKRDKSIMQIVCQTLLSVAGTAKSGDYPDLKHHQTNGMSGATET